MSEQKQLLLVEDEAIIALAEKALLDRAGYRVVHVRTGEEAVRIIRDNAFHIDLILMDIDLGSGMDGTQAAEEILRLIDIPLVFVSSHTEKEYTERTEQITSYGYVLKYSDDTVLLASMKMAFKLFEANTALRESGERFRLLAENARDLIYRIELVPERRFSYVSPAATRITGYTPEEHYRDPELGFKLVHPDDRTVLMDVLENHDTLGRPLVLRWCRKDGEVIWTEQNNVPIYDDNGSLVAIEGIARDITYRKQLEETLEASNRRLAAFLRVSKAVTSATEQGSLLRLVVESAAEVTELQSNAIYLKHGNDAIRLVAATPSIPEDFPEQFRVAQLRDHPPYPRGNGERGKSSYSRYVS